ncbi:MAG: alpha/beta fold hydrolase [Gemmatimonadaceae bacterium]
MTTRNRRTRGVIATIVMVIVAILVISWMLGSLLVRSTNSDVAASRAPAEDVTIVTADGLALAATFRPGVRTDAPAVLLLHGSGASRDQTASNAEWLSQQGYATLAIDFRGHGRSPAASHSFGWYESTDVRAAFAWLKRRELNAPVAVIGISLGGAAALIGEDGPVPADAMVLQGVYSDIRHTIRNRMASMISRMPAILFEPLLSYQSRLRFGVWPSRLSPLDGLRRYRGPVLVIGGASDPFTPPEETRRMFGAAPGRKTLWLAPGADHEGISDLSTEAYRTQLLSFLRQSIGAP